MQEEESMFGKVDGIGFDGRKDATLETTEVNEKYYTSTVLEEHYVITGEPGKFKYLYLVPISLFLLHDILTNKSCILL